MEGQETFGGNKDKIKEDSKLLEKLEVCLPHFGLLVKWIDTRVALFLIIRASYMQEKYLTIN